jgi:hypothetical protein
MILELNVFFKIITTKPSCSRKQIPNKLKLRKANLVLTRVECERNSKLKKNHCLPKESFLSYRCRNGYIFETRKSKIKLID